MDIEVMDYFRRFADGEYNLLHVGLVYLTGFASVWLSGKLLSSREPLERPGALTLAAVAPLIGLILTSTVYPCRSCNAPPGCDIVTVGVPFPQEARERDPGPVQTFGACWWSLTERSETAALANFALGTLGIPLIVGLFRPYRREQDPAAGPPPVTGPDPAG